MALRSDRAEAGELGQLVTAGESDEEAIGRATALIESSGARQVTEDEAVRQLAGALECLDTVAVPDPVRSRLVELARFVVEREV